MEFVTVRRFSQVSGSQFQQQGNAGASAFVSTVLNHKPDRMSLRLPDEMDSLDLRVLYLVDRKHFK